MSRLERDIVLGNVDGLAHRLTLSEVSTTIHAAATAARTAEQRDPVGLDLGGVPLVAVLVVPLPGLQTTLDVDLFALLRGIAAGSRPACPTAPRGATRSFPAAGRPCRSRFPSWPDSASRRPRRQACSLSSASRPRLPTRMTLFTLPMSVHRPAATSQRYRLPPCAGRSRLCFARRPRVAVWDTSSRRLERLARLVGLPEAARSYARSCNTPPAGCRCCG